MFKNIPHFFPSLYLKLYILFARFSYTLLSILFIFLLCYIYLFIFVNATICSDLPYEFKKWHDFGFIGLKVAINTLNMSKFGQSFTNEKISSVKSIIRNKVNAMIPSKSWTK